MRTDLLRVCPPCRLRVAADSSFCPRCEGEGLVDARLEPIAWPGIRPARTLGGPLAFAAVVAVALAAIAYGEAIAWRRFVSPEEGAALWFFVPFSLLMGLAIGVLGAAAVAIVGWAIGRAALRAFGRRAPRPVRPRLRVERVTVPHDLEWTAGVARRRGNAEHRAPLSGRACLAFRIAGQVDGHEVDDAAAVDLDLEQDDGSRIHVRAAPAIVALEPGEPVAVSGEGRARLREFLAVRGLPASGTIALAEAVVEPGDAIEVAGVHDEELDANAPAGFRELGRRVVLRPAPAVPIVLRRR